MGPDICRPFVEVAVPKANVLKWRASGRTRTCSGVQSKLGHILLFLMSMLSLPQCVWSMPGDSDTAQAVTAAAVATDYPGFGEDSPHTPPVRDRHEYDLGSPPGTVSHPADELQIQCVLFAPGFPTQSAQVKAAFPVQAAALLHSVVAKLGPSRAYFAADVDFVEPQLEEGYISLLMVPQWTAHSGIATVIFDFSAVSGPVYAAMIDRRPPFSEIVDHAERHTCQPWDAFQTGCTVPLCSTRPIHLTTGDTLKFVDVYGQPHWQPTSTASLRDRDFLTADIRCIVSEEVSDQWLIVAPQVPTTKAWRPMLPRHFIADQKHLGYAVPTDKACQPMSTEVPSLLDSSLPDEALSRLNMLSYRELLSYWIDGPLGVPWQRAGDAARPVLPPARYDEDAITPDPTIYEREYRAEVLPLVLRAPCDPEEALHEIQDARNEDQSLYFDTLLPVEPQPDNRLFSIIVPTRLTRPVRSAVLVHTDSVPRVISYEPNPAHTLPELRRFTAELLGYSLPDTIMYQSNPAIEDVEHIGHTCKALCVATQRAHHTAPLADQARPQIVIIDARPILRDIEWVHAVQGVLDYDALCARFEPAAPSGYAVSIKGGRHELRAEGTYVHVPQAGILVVQFVQDFPENSPGPNRSSSQELEGEDEQAESESASSDSSMSSTDNGATEDRRERSRSPRRTDGAAGHAILSPGIIASLFGGTQLQVVVASNFPATLDPKGVPFGNSPLPASSFYGCLGDLHLGVLNFKLLGDPGSYSVSQWQENLPTFGDGNQEQVSWTYSAPFDHREPLATDTTGFQDELQQASEDRRLYFVVATPEYTLYQTEVTVTIPAVPPEALAAVRAARPTTDRRQFPILHPANPQPIAGCGLFLAEPSWGPQPPTICFDTRLIDGRLFAKSGRSYADRIPALLLVPSSADLCVQSVSSLRGLSKRVRGDHCVISTCDDLCGLLVSPLLN
ncbi:unnamed protein product [Symbiodinium sp. CCMP2592]|nr:unnamed protein product [Symbiodinium sp. CCMP2592]